MTPFLEKLLELCQQCPETLAGWSEDGMLFEVRDTPAFTQFIQSFFKGTLKTFIRQLHFYGFSKQDVATGVWGFCHPEFTQDNEEGIFNISRKTRNKPEIPATKDEVLYLRKELHEMKRVFAEEVVRISEKLEKIYAAFANQPAPSSNNGKRKVSACESTSSITSYGCVSNNITESSSKSSMSEFDLDDLFAVQPPAKKPIIKEESAPWFNCFDQTYENHTTENDPLDDLLVLPLSDFSLPTSDIGF